MHQNDDKVEETFLDNQTTPKIEVTLRGTVPSDSALISPVTIFKLNY